MTIKQQIFNFVKSQNRPCTRKEIYEFYLKLTKKAPNPNYMTTCLANVDNNVHNRTRGYLLKGEFALTKIGHNQYIAR